MDPGTVGLLGFLLALLLGTIRIWEAAFQRPRFKIDFRFNVDGATRVVDSAYLSVMNIGRAKGGVLHMRFRSGDEPPEQGLSSWEVVSQLPMVLDMNDARRIRIPIANTSGELAPGLVSGELSEVLLVDLRGKEHRFPLPSPPKLPPGAQGATFPH